MSRIVAKFGGSSVADASQIAKVRRIVEQEPKRRVIVVSAPGKRVPSENKITDLLYLCSKMASMHTDFVAPFATLSERFLEIERDLGVNVGMADELARFRAELRHGCSRDFTASRGEYFSARLIAAYLGAEFVDAKDHIRIAPNGLVEPSSYASLAARLGDESKLYLVPGFYGSNAHGEVVTFSRGGSDITGAIAARAVEAEVYENWTDVSGLLMADPRIVDTPGTMSEVTYRELRELAYMGASVLHDEATLPVREVALPIVIKNTNQPEHPGTRIVPKLSREVDQSTEIAGIAGKRAFSMFCIEKSLMNKEVGFAYRTLGVFERRGISVEHCPSSIDGFNVIVESESLRGRADEIVAEIDRLLSPDQVTVEHDLGLIAVVGEGMKQAIGISAKVFSALRDAKVNVRVIDQGASEVNIIIGVAPDDFERAIRCLYSAFVN